MVITAMDMVPKIKLRYLTVLFLTISSSSQAGDWVFNPAIQLSETYSDNISLDTTDKEDSFVTKASAVIQGGYESPLANLKLISAHSFHSYSHDSELNDDTRNLSAIGNINLFDGFSLNSNIRIQNISRNDAENSLDDLVTENTVESRNYNIGARYQIQNSRLNFNSSLNYDLREVDDNIGESEGYTANYSTTNGTGARNIFWSSNGRYNDRQNQGNTGQTYSYEIKVGWISPYKLTPFVRYYDEDSSGNISSGNNTQTKSWGPGLRWRISKHLILDTSYNYVSDESASDDYVDAEINWLPSSRTKLIASYSKRFFGKSYAFDFSHRSKRLTNQIKYEENLTAFSRDSYIINESGDLELIEDNEFSLTKFLDWRSTLDLSRTTINLSLSNRARESLESDSTDETFISRISATRKLSRQSSFTFEFNFENKNINKGSTTGSEQIDYYRTYSANYNRQLLHALSTNFSVKYLDRSSTTDSRNYDEVRGVLTISKEF